MGLRHREFEVEGVQFHPESILTPVGKDLLANFLGLRQPALVGAPSSSWHSATEPGGAAAMAEQPTFDIRQAIQRVVEGRELTAPEDDARRWM